MKKLLAVLITSLFAVTNVYAAAHMKAADDKKGEAKKGDMKKDEAKKGDKKK